MMVSPVRVHMTMVSQNTAVMEISACFTGDSDAEEPAVTAAVPMPASLVKSPRAMPKREDISRVLPTNPPPAARVVKAAEKIREKVSGRTLRFCHNKRRHAPM